MLLFKQPAVKKTESVSALIPVFDFGPYFADEPGALAQLATQLRHGCENISFLYALNHGVPQEIVDRGFAASRRFHALPLEEKLTTPSPRSGATKTRPAHGPTRAATGSRRRRYYVFVGSLWFPAPADQGRGQPEAISTSRGTGPSGRMPWFASVSRILPIRGGSKIYFGAYAPNTPTLPHPPPHGIYPP